MSDYKSIDEIMTGKAPGSVELVSEVGARFTPHFRSGCHWHGLDDDREHDYWVGNSIGWQVYTPPPAPVERPQLWWVKQYGEWVLSDIPRTSKEQALENRYEAKDARPSGIYAPDEIK